MQVTRIFSFFYNVFKSRLSQGLENSQLFNEVDAKTDGKRKKPKKKNPAPSSNQVRPNSFTVTGICIGNGMTILWSCTYKLLWL